MGRVFVTGDKHGDYDKLSKQLQELKTTQEDVVIILGDHGTLYYGPRDDRRKKKLVSNIPATFIMIRGNHDRRASNEEYGHQLTEVHSPYFEGTFYIDPNFPSILYTKEWGWYRFGSKPVFVINGAYSVDKYRRLEMQAMGFSNYHWFANEQLDQSERFLTLVDYMDNAPEEKMHYVMTHTCPLRYKPWDKLMGCVDQKTVDESTEQWLNSIEAAMPYQKWYCGHWHIDRLIDRMRFMYDDIELFDEIKEETNESISE